MNKPPEKEWITSEKTQEKAKTEIFPKEGKTRFSQETAEKRRIP